MEEPSFKRKNVFVITFELLIIILGVGGITFAASQLINSRSQTILTIGEYNVDYQGDKEITMSSLEPISDDLVNIDTKDNVIRLDFSLKGVSTNDKDELIYDIMLTDINIDCSLLNEYTKWNLYKNGNLLSSGSFSPKFDGNILSDNYRLTEIQEDLKDYNDSYDNYTFIVWISESCDDLTTCKLIDQTNILNSNMSMKLFIALYSGSKLKYERIPSNDNSCTSTPELYNNMIPITYKDGSYVITSKDNKFNEWYNYEEGKWANAIVTKNRKYKKGDIVKDEDVLAYYVWIPRFKYKTWNVEDTLDDTYNALDNGIDIVFSGSSSNENIKNNEYIVHPAFENRNGFWISKYEVSKDDTYKFIPNNTSYTGDILENYQSIMNNLQEEYSLGETVNSHLVTNLEWGATLYLSHSKYGVCNSDGCMNIGMNDTYISGSNKQDTTTRNVFGVYDMNGSAAEYVIGYNEIGSANKEVIGKDGIGWYGSYITNTDRGYFLRGGINSNLFSQKDISMSDTLYGGRSVLTKEAKSN